MLFTNKNSSSRLNRQNCTQCEISHWELLVAYSFEELSICFY